MAAAALDRRERHCGFCENPQTEDRTLLKCARCKKVFYCGEECQRGHWPTHRQVCVEKKPKSFRKIIGPAVSELLTTLGEFIEAPCRGERINATDSLGEKKDALKALGGIQVNEELLQRYLDHQMYDDVIGIVFSEDDVNLRLNWLKDHVSQGHVMIMLIYCDMLQKQAFIDHPDGNLPIDLHIDIVSSYIIFLCQLKMDIFCLKEEAQQKYLSFMLKCTDYTNFLRLLHKGSHYSEINERVLSYFDQIEFTNLPSPKYICNESLVLPKDVWASKRQEAVENFKLVCRLRGPAKLTLRLFRM